VHRYISSTHLARLVTRWGRYDELRRGRVKPTAHSMHFRGRRGKSSERTRSFGRSLRTDATRRILRPGRASSPQWTTVRSSSWLSALGDDFARAGAGCTSLLQSMDEQPFLLRAVVEVTNRGIDIREARQVDAGSSPTSAAHYWDRARKGRAASRPATGGQEPAEHGPAALDSTVVSPARIIPHHFVILATPC